VLLCLNSDHIGAIEVVHRDGTEAELFKIFVAEDAKRDATNLTGLMDTHRFNFSWLFGVEAVRRGSHSVRFTVSKYKSEAVQTATTDVVPNIPQGFKLELFESHLEHSIK
jgi:hypothetical protein